jgi:DNA mismatch repair ATPase MutS
MKKILFATLCLISFNAFSSQVAPAEDIKKKKEELDALLLTKAQEHLRVENTEVLRRCADDPTVTPKTAKRTVRVQTLSRMASSIQTETGKIFKNATLLKDLELRKKMAAEILNSQEPTVEEEIKKEGEEDAFARLQLQVAREAKRQEALKKKWCCCWRLCDSD